MMNNIVLAGGAEFGGAMAAVDRAALAHAGGLNTAVRIIPTAAAPDNNHARAGQNGVRWFRSLGATDVAVVSIIDAASANDAEHTAVLAEAGLIYLLGGFPQHLHQTLAGSAAWQACLTAQAHGAVIAGSSAGAMVLCDSYFSPSGHGTETGLGLVAPTCVLPHHDTFGHKWVPRLTELLPHSTLLGIDERTGMIGSAAGQWEVHGQGTVVLYYAGNTAVFSAGQTFSLPS